MFLFFSSLFLSFLFFSSFGRFRAGIRATGRKKADKRRSVVCYPGAKKVKPKNQKPGIFFPPLRRVGGRERKCAFLKSCVTLLVVISVRGVHRMFP
jgi:hypothetical protein